MSLLEQRLVRLVYRREGKAYTFQGTIASPKSYLNFAGRTFEEILGFASEVLKENEDCRLLVKRDEAPYPMTLPSNVEELLRTDLPKAIAALSLGPQRIIVIGVPCQVNLGGLRHGLDTLADALGEEVYLRFRYMGSVGMQVEDPVTGRWSQTSGDDRILVCGALRIERQTASTGNHWCTAKTEDILALQQPRYYLPRGWNPSEGWITHGDLQNMFETYKEEKDHAARS